MYYTHIQVKAKVMCIYMVYMYTLLFICIFMFRTIYNLYCIKNVVSIEKCIVYTLHIYFTSIICFIYFMLCIAYIRVLVFSM